MAELSVREQIMRDLKTTLEGITVANGYATDIGTVTRGVGSPLETSELPMASLLPVNDLLEYMPQAAQRVLTVTVRVWVDIDALADVASALEALMADVEEIMQVDPRRGGYAENTRTGVTQYIYVEASETLAGADIAFEIDYKVSLASPRVQA